MWIVSGLLLIIEMDEEDRGRAEEQRVIVAGPDEGIECDKPVAAGTIFDDDRLAQRVLSRSANSLAVMSVALAAPNGRMRRTVRAGYVCCA